jgi:transposase
MNDIPTHFKHRFGNAIAEAMNRRIQDLIRKACGYRNRERFKTDVLFHLGGLDLYSASSRREPRGNPGSPTLRNASYWAAI